MRGHDVSEQHVDPCTVHANGLTTGRHDVCRRQYSGQTCAVDVECGSARGEVTTFQRRLRCTADNVDGDAAAVVYDRWTVRT